MPTLCKVGGNPKEGKLPYSKVPSALSETVRFSLILENLNLYITEYLIDFKANLHVKYLIAPPKQFLKGNKGPITSFDLQLNS
jgi:hypothetical protein